MFDVVLPNVPAFAALPVNELKALHDESPITIAGARNQIVSALPLELRSTRHEAKSEDRSPNPIPRFPIHQSPTE